MMLCKCHRSTSKALKKDFGSAGGMSCGAS